MDCRVFFLITGPLFFALATGCIFSVEHEAQDESDSSFISIDGPGDQVVVDSDGFAIQYNVDCQLEDCADDLWCRLGDQDSQEADFEPCTLPLEVTDDDVGEGRHTVEVELRIGDELLETARYSTVVLFDFDVVVDRFTSDQPHSFSHPFLGETSLDCTHQRCEIDECRWEDSLDGDVDSCELDEPLWLEIPDDAGDSPALLIRGCIDIEDATHCQQQELSFDYTDPVWTDVDAGSSHSCAILDDNTLWCWGDNESGQLGIDSQQSSHETPERVPGFDWTTAATGDLHSCAIDTDGRLFCWGANDRGQLGIGSEGDEHRTPQLVDAGPFHTVTAGHTHSCAIDADDALYCWGQNDFGQLGTGSEESFPEPTLVNTPDDSNGEWIDVSAGRDYTCGLAVSGSLHTAYCWGANDDSQLGIDGIQLRNEPRGVEGPLESMETIQIAASTDHTCAIAYSLNTPTTAYCWGNGDSGKLGNAGYTSQTHPTPVEGGQDYIGVSTGRFHSCAIDGDADPATVRCWGQDGMGQLGSGEPNSSNTPLELDEPNWSEITTLVSGNHHNIALDADGTLYAWGAGNSGQLGVGYSSDVFSPLPIDWPYEFFTDSSGN